MDGKIIIFVTLLGGLSQAQRTVPPEFMNPMTFLRPFLPPVFTSLIPNFNSFNSPGASQPGLPSWPLQLPSPFGSGFGTFTGLPQPTGFQEQAPNPNLPTPPTWTEPASQQTGFPEPPTVPEPEAQEPTSIQ